MSAQLCLKGLYNNVWLDFHLPYAQEEEKTHLERILQPSVPQDIAGGDTQYF